MQRKHVKINYSTNHHLNLGDVVLYMGQFERLVKFKEFEKFYNKGKPKWGLGTPLGHALSSGFNFRIVEVIND